ncbi:ATP-binding protein [Candidatus Symbiobacter mobilis]|uniref:ATPase-like protein n=1 Tax=Candidatus Symbiobacter mobilis CR TaxID=946483 RepID=U5N941_9BURK|nr:ATP-binding protein [Candidatus Symbiobacter mobilis]AGX87825.1 ATPase-like protein [Candidatus Symbiobacter mobilis CR]
MVRNPEPTFQRPQAAVLAGRLNEPRRCIQVVAGPRQVGKSTLVQQVTATLPQPVRYASADEPMLRGAVWIAQQWEAARLAIENAEGAVLVLDEIQKIAGWSETVKRLWDEDTRARCPLQVVLLGSAPLLIAQGLTESLAGRFEVLPLSHWSLAEMHAAFGWSVEQYVFYGGYPGAAPLVGEHKRWARYVADSLIETSIARDVLLLTRVDKPALLRRLFELACHYSGQVLSYTKMLGQLQDAGNTTTLAHYLNLLAGAGMVCGVPKYARDVARNRASSPKLQVLNTALMTVTSGLTLDEARADREFWGRLVESAVGAHLANAAMRGECTLHYWREGNREVDFIVQAGRRLTAIEVKSGRAPLAHPGISAFAEAFQPQRSLLVGGDGIALEDFLLRPVAHWVAG